LGLQVGRVGVHRVGRKVAYGLDAGRRRHLVDVADRRCDMLWVTSCNFHRGPKVGNVFRDRPSPLGRHAFLGRVDDTPLP